MRTRLLRFVVLATAVATIPIAGCTPDEYKREADLQVSKLVKDRERQTLSYAPQVEVRDDPTPAAPHKPYEMIPASPLPVASGSVLEPVKVVVPYGAPGPDKVMSAGEKPMGDSDFYYGLDAPSKRLDNSFQMGPVAPNAPVTRLDLFRALRFATDHSREYQTQMEDLYLAALDVTLERHLFFEPSPFVTQSFTFDGGQEDVKYRSALTAATSVGVRQRLPYGGEVVAQSLVQFVDALNNHTTDGENANLALSATVPLLRGAGRTYLDPVISSERQLVYAVRSFEEYRRQFLVDIASDYFNLVSAERQVANRRTNVETFAALTEKTLALYGAGKVTYLDVQRSLASQYSAESSLVNTLESYQSQIDSFKITLGMDPDEQLEIVPIELQASVPRLELDDAVKLALQYRLDLQTARDQVDDAQRKVDVAKNGLLPDLNLTADTHVFNNVGSDARNLSAGTGTYSAGVTLDLPIDRLAERNAYRRSLINLQRAQRSYATLRDTVSVSARNAMRRIRSAQTNVELQRKAIELAEQRLIYANDLLRQGKVDSREVVDAQQALLDAQDSFNSAQAQLQIQVLQYFKQTGTLRIDPAAGALARALDRGGPSPEKLPGMNVQ